MKVVILLCLVALAVAHDGAEQRYGPGYGDIDDGHRFRPRPYPYPRPNGYYRPGSVNYHYNIDYDKDWARQGKQETIDRSGTRGSYFVTEPNSNTYVKYDYPRHRYW